MSYIQGGGSGSGGGGLPPAGGNLVYYVATTGNDSNSGLTALSPFATVQHAINVVTAFDYQSSFFPTVNVAAGTYSLTDAILAPPLTNIKGSALLIGDTVTPGNVILWDTTGRGCFINEGLNSKWTLNGFQLDSFGPMLQGNSSFMSLLNMNYTDRTNSGFGFIFAPTGFSHMDTGGAVSSFTSTILSASFTNLAQVDLFAHMTIADASMNFPVGGVNFNSGVMNGFDNAEMLWQPLAQPNAGAVTGAKAFLAVESFIATPNGQLTDLPGSTSGSGDDTCALISLGTGIASMYANVKSGLPTTTDIFVGGWSVWKDTAGGGVYVAYNDAGTIKKVALT